MPARIIAVDWSGAVTGGSRNALAEAASGQLLHIEDRMSRRQVVDQLIEMKQKSIRTVIGLDFGFSTPAWYLDQQGFAEAPDLWRWLADCDNANELLRECAPPFWGFKGKPRPELREHFRATEAAITAVGGISPKSIFRINGQGSVGTGSLRGMCALHKLRENGFAIWPFDDQGAHTLIEIYPRILTGPVKKSVASARREYLNAISGSMDDVSRVIAGDSEDAFDAAVSAIGMSKHASDLATLPHINDPQLRREGIIWHPAWRTTLST